MFRLKMAQANEMFDKVYQDTKSNAPQSFQDTITIAPTLQVPRAIMDKLQMMQALGFNIADYSNVMFLTAYLADRSIQGLIADMNPAEFAQVVEVVNGAQPGQYDKPPEPNPSKTTTEEPQVEAPGPSDKEMNDNRLVQTLQDLGQKREKDLSLAKQKQLVDPTREKTDPNAKDAIKVSMRRIIQAAIDPEVVELFGALLDIGFEIDNRKYGMKVLSRLPPELAAKALALDESQWHEAVIAASEDQFTPEKNQGIVPDSAQSNPEKPAATMKQVSPVSQDPSGNISKKDIPKIKQSLVDQYDSFADAFKDLATTVPYGESTGLRIYSLQSGKSSMRKVAMGGDFVFHFQLRQEGMVMGLAPGTTQLLVLTMPEGSPEFWETEAWNPDVVGKDNVVVLQESKQASPHRSAQVSDPNGKPVNLGDVIQVDQNQVGTVMEVMQDGNIVYQDNKGEKAVAQPGSQFEVVKNDQNNNSGAPTPMTVPSGTTGAGGPSMI